MTPKQKLDQVLVNLEQIEYRTRTKNKRHRILLYLNDNSLYHYKPIVIARALGIEPPTTRQQLAILLYAGFVAKDENCNYWITPKGQEFIKITDKIKNQLKNYPKSK